MISAGLLPGICPGISASGVIDYLLHGLNWGCLCADGDSQSPVGIPPDEDCTFIDVDIVCDVGSIGDGLCIYSENGIEIDFDVEGSGLTIDCPDLDGDLDDLDLELSGSIVLHSPSEHCLDDGTHYDLEIQILFEDPVGGEKVIVVLFCDLDIGGDSENDLLASLKLDLLNTVTSVVKVKVDLDDLLIAIHGNVAIYQGSLTTPPCDEGVWWILCLDVFPISTG